MGKSELPLSHSQDSVHGRGERHACSCSASVSAVACWDGCPVPEALLASFAMPDTHFKRSPGQPVWWPQGPCCPLIPSLPLTQQWPAVGIPVHCAVPVLQLWPMV
jgi:hypothetical protein